MKQASTFIDTAFDRQHICHPYTSMVDPLPCYAVRTCQGVTITLDSGQELIDGMASWWAAIHGYNHPVLNAAIKKQLASMAHIMFGGLTHQPAVTLCQQLMQVTPSALTKIFLCDSGSVAVEVALKMALQYWHARREKRDRFLSLRNAYHGDTFGAMSVTDPVNSMHTLYHRFLPQQHFAPAPKPGFADPWQEQDMDDFDRVLSACHDQIAAVILEPIVQGAGGMRFYHPNFLAGVRARCDHYGILLIADEIATGFGRTGKLFACEHAAVTPDILCLGKALTGGYLSFAATLTTTSLAETLSAQPPFCFMHGPTFMGNPLACATASANLTLLEQGNWQHQVASIECYFAETLPVFRTHPKVRAVRWLGAIGVLELHQPINVALAQRVFVAAGVWIRPFRNLIYLMPPYIISAAQLDQLLLAIRAVLDT